MLHAFTDRTLGNACPRRINRSDRFLLISRLIIVGHRDDGRSALINSGNGDRLILIQRRSPGTIVDRHLQHIAFLGPDTEFRDSLIAPEPPAAGSSAHEAREGHMVLFMPLGNGAHIQFFIPERVIGKKGIAIRNAQTFQCADPLRSQPESFIIQFHSDCSLLNKEQASLLLNTIDSAVTQRLR